MMMLEESVIYCKFGQSALDFQIFTNNNLKPTLWNCGNVQRDKVLSKIAWEKWLLESRQGDIPVLHLLIIQRLKLYWVKSVLTRWYTGTARIDNPDIKTILKWALNCFISKILEYWWKDIKHINWNHTFFLHSDSLTHLLINTLA